ncbi:MAG: hypothetical protein ACRCWI_02565 [Brevinema sp.]
MASLKRLKKQELLELMVQYKLPTSPKMTKEQLVSVLETYSILQTSKQQSLSSKTSPSKTDTSSAISKAKSNPSPQKSKVPKKSPILKESSSRLKVINSSQPLPPISKAKKTPPTKTMTPTFDNNITVLVQSYDKALVIWNANPLEDQHIKAWKLQNNGGLDILVPNYTRSIFIELSMLDTLEFSLYRINLDESVVLFQTYQDKNPISANNTFHQQLPNYPNISKKELQKIVDKHLNEYKQHFSSHQHFSS